MMRPILPADLDLATRVLMAVPSERRAPEMDAMLRAACSGEETRRRTGGLLPGHGDGSLLAVALLRPREGQCPAGRVYRACLRIVLDRIEALERQTV
jgi:hypothetical protein